jgi:hypothetical protein
VPEPGSTSGDRKIYLELDALAAQYTLDVWTDHLKGLSAQHVDHWASNDLFRRYPHELLVCTVTKEVPQIPAATRQSYSSGIQYLAHFVLGVGS